MKALWLGLLLALPGVTETPVAPRIHPVPPPVELRLPDAPEASPGALTAEGAARLALERQPELRVALAAAEAAAGQTAQARSGLFPWLSLSSSYNNQTPLTGDSRFSGGGNPAAGGGGSQAQAQLRQLIWDFNRTDSVVGEAYHEQLAVEADYQRARADLVLDAKSAFFDWVAFTEEAQVVHANLENQRHNLALAQARWESGLGLPADLVQAQTAVAAATVNLNRARAAELSARVRLARVLGLDPRTPLVADLTPSQPPPNGDLNALIEEALPRRPEMQVVLARVESAEYGLKAAEKNNLPALVATAGPVARGPSFPPENAFLQAGVSLQWPFFDGGLTGGLVDQASADLESARARLETVRNLLIAEILQASLELSAAEGSLGAAEAGTENAREAVRIAEGRYKAGLGNFQEVLDNQAALLTASTNLVQARRLAQVARARFERALGMSPGLK
ncbi:MAG: hypothetical protein AMXMBFR33_49610 [Candidatus Xenobia bacterium]